MGVRWNPFRRSPAHSRDAQLLARGEEAAAHDAAGRHELALEAFTEVVAAYRQELAERPDDPVVTALLSDRLNGLGQSLAALRRFDEATAAFTDGLAVSRRAVALRRATADGAGDPDLARALRTFALVRANAGDELDEAARAVDDAAAVHMAALAAAPDREQLDEAYATERVQARVLARQGRHVEAARVAELARSGHLDGLADVLRAQRAPAQASEVADRPG